MSDVTTTSTTTSAAPAADIPWWRYLIDKVVPESRGLWLVALFALGWKLLDMVKAKPEMLGDTSFMTIAVLLLGTGGIGAANNFLFGGTKTGAEVMASQQKVIAQNATSPAPPPDTVTTVTTNNAA